MLIYYSIINTIGLLIMGIDKYLAIKQKYRIPEITLLAISFLGGCFGSLLGMYLFHHKTKKWKFKLGIPIFIILHLIFIYYL